jgi:hypothetical protein
LPKTGTSVRIEALLWQTRSLKAKDAFDRGTCQFHFSGKRAKYLIS